MLERLCVDSRRGRRHCSVWRALLYCVFMWLLTNECLVYWIQSWRWAQLPTKSDGDESVRILFVADPQIQGFHGELPIIGYLTRWDADWYLKKTFQLSADYVQPDVIVYLGDLLDEGSHATDSEFEIYVKRFRGIFNRFTSHSKEVYIAGDNDVGGEGADPITKKKISRFNQYFGGNTQVETVKFLDFLKLELDASKDSNPGTESYFENVVSHSHSKIKILICHIGVMYRRELDKIHMLTRTVNPNLIVTADIHKSVIFNCENCRSKRRLHQRWYGNQQIFHGYSIIKINLFDEAMLTEIVVPTCSYRMGVPSMGYGAAVIDSHGVMHYTVLWSPSRYTQLLWYIPLLLLLGAALCVQILVYIISSLADRDRDKFWRSY